MDLAYNIVRLRKRAGLTQAQLADKLNMTPAAVSKWETGAATPDLDTLIALADYFRVTVDELLGHIPNKHTAVVFYPDGKDDQMIRRVFAECGYRLLGLGHSMEELYTILAERKGQGEHVEFLVTLTVNTHINDHIRNQLGYFKELFSYDAWIGRETTEDRLERGLRSLLMNDMD